MGSYRLAGYALPIEASSHAEARAILTARRAEQATKEERLREIRGDVFLTEAEAIAACAVHDKALGLPNAAMERWTVPIEVDTGWLVQRPDRSGALVDRARVKVVDETTAKATVKR